MEDNNQNEVEALCPECGHAFKKFVDRVIQSGQKLPEKHDIECPVCGVWGVPHRTLTRKFQVSHVSYWLLHESEAFICKALEGEAIVYYCKPLITQHMKTSGSPFRVKIDEKKHHPINQLDKMYDLMMLF